MARADRRHPLSPVTRGALLVVTLVTGAVLTLHVAAWPVALVVLARDLHPPPAQSAFALAASALALRSVSIASRRRRTIVIATILGAFVAATFVLPLATQYAGVGFMGDGVDYAQDRDKFERNVPVAAGKHEIEFKSHLGDMFLGAVDRLAGRTDASPAFAYRSLSRLGGLLFVAELLIVLLVFRGSRRAARFVGLALAAPLALGFFGYYEVGYLAASIGTFPLVVHSIRRGGRARTLEAGGFLQGLHAAFHGMGLLGIAGGALAALTARTAPISAALRYVAFALAAYLGWVLIYIVVLKVSVIADPYAAHIAFRHLTTAFYFDRRLVHPLLSWNAAAEIGMTSLAVGVPLLVLSLPRTRSMPDRAAALVFALPGLAFLVVWWSSAGVNRDMDLLLGVYAGIGGALWLASRSPRTAFQGWVVAAFVHVMFWAVIADRTMDRIWLSP